MVALEVVAHQLMIIGGLVLFVTGLFGNVLNLFVFTSWIRSGSKRGAAVGASNGPLYLYAASVGNLILICYPLIVRILVDGYGYSVTKGNALYLCKLRYFVLQIAHLGSLCYTCLATLDRFLLSSRIVRVRQMSFDARQTKHCIAIVFIIMAIHSIPLAVYYNDVNHQCAFVSDVYALYYLFVVIILLYGVLPTIFLLVFGSLTLIQLQAATHRSGRHDRQLSRMHLIQSISVVLSSILYIVYNIYSSSLVANTATSNKSPSELLFQCVSVIMFYIHSSTNFYIFYFSTANFRKSVKKLFRCGQHAVNNNQVAPAGLSTTHHNTLRQTTLF